MWLPSLFASWNSGLSRSRRPQPRPARRGTRLVLEHLEDRALPSNYSAASVSDLIADINAANTAGGANTISLTAPTTSPYALTAVDNSTNGATGLPVIAANDNLTILGNGDIIDRSTAAPAFRLLEVASGASLTLENLTLQGGMTWGVSRTLSGLAGAAEGGAIFSQGTLVLYGVTVLDNTAGILNRGQYPQKGNGIDAAGGGIFSSGGSVTLEGGTIVQNNEAIGLSTLTTYDYGGNAYGGGLYASGGTVTVTNATLDHNTAVSGYGVAGVFAGGPDGVGFPSGGDGFGYGGGLYASGGTVTLTNATLDGNVAGNPYGEAGYGGGNGGGAYGGGLYLANVTTASPTLTNCTVQANSALGTFGPGLGGGLFISGIAVGLDAATVAQVTGNTASSGAAYDNIVGPYVTTIPAAPSNLTATASLQKGSAQVQLQWNNNNSNNQSAEVVVQRSSDGGATWTTIVEFPEDLGGNFTDTTVARKTSYVYRVYAYNLLGSSPYSNLATVKTP